MNYRDFYKNKKATAKDIQNLIPEGVDQKEFNKGIGTEKEHTDDEFTAAKIAGDHLKEDPKYYTKLSDAGLEEENIEGDVEDAETDMMGDDYDDNGGLPKVGGALAIPHIGQPIMMGKIIQVGGEFKGGKSASGEQSGMTNCAGVNKDKGGVPVQPVNDKETITAGGKRVDGSIASKSVGGSVVPGEGQKQGGPNSQGTIAATAKLNEHKNKIRSILKEVLKEIRYDKTSGKWIKINEEVNMKMGASYKTVQPRLYKVSDDDFARKNQYEPEISEMYDDEEECMMNERYVELANEQRNLSEAELTELKTLREKINHVNDIRKNYGASQGGIEPNLYEDGERSDHDIASSETHPTDYEKCDGCGKQNYMCDCPSKHGEEGDFGHDGFMRELPTGELKEFGEDEHPDDARERREFERGIARNNRRNPQRYECPTCKTPNALSHDQKQKGYQCDRCADSEEGAFQETVDMKMGPSYKTVQPRMYKVSDDDFARKNQYQSDMSEGQQCSDDCDLKHCQVCGGHMAGGHSAGNICNVCDEKEHSNVNEAGVGAVQHSSYRTVKHGNLKQDPKQRWANDLDEGQSKVAKAIAKGQKGKVSTFKQSLKHKKPSKTSSGVHKRKP